MSDKNSPMGVCQQTCKITRIDIRSDVSLRVESSHELVCCSAGYFSYILGVFYGAYFTYSRSFVASHYAEKKKIQTHDGPTNWAQKLIYLSVNRGGSDFLWRGSGWGTKPLKSRKSNAFDHKWLRRNRLMIFTHLQLSLVPLDCALHDNNKEDGIERK